MNQIELKSIRHLDDKFSHRQRQWAWQNGLTLEESLGRLLADPSYCEKFGAFLMKAAEHSPERGSVKKNSAVGGPLYLRSR